MKGMKDGEGGDDGGGLKKMRGGGVFLGHSLIVI